MPPSMSALLNDRYELGPVLGRGGMGVVHRGRDRLLEREVAIKLVLETDGQDARFIAEAKRTAALSHPGIVAVFDTGRSDGQSFIVMELLRGESLEERLKREGRLPLEEVLRIGGEICDALAVAHEHGIIHRDIKPANIFLAVRSQGAPPAVKVVDFGIAKKLGEAQLTDPGTMVGSYATMSPEQIRGEELDGRADLYSLGVVLYRAATGGPPFTATNAAGLILAHLNESVPRLAADDLDVSLAPRANAAVQRLLAKHRADRPASAAEAKKLLLADAPKVSEPALSEIPDLAIAAPSRAPREDERAAPIVSLIQLESTREEALPASEVATASLASFDVDARPAPLLVTAHALQMRIDLATPAAPEATGLQAISPEVSKRIAGYSAFLLVVLSLLFNVPLLVLVLLGASTIFGVTAYIVATNRKR